MGLAAAGKLVVFAVEQAQAGVGAVLLEGREHLNGAAHPAAVVLVGFVGAADSKAALAENTKVPYITVEGTKGGSPIAAASVNAIMYLIDNSRF